MTAARMWRASAIEWDTDGESVELPRTVELAGDALDLDTAADALSDAYGWTVDGFLLERVPFRVTYETVTPESAAAGDLDDSGFLDADGNRVPALIGRPTPGVQLTLREALRLASPNEDSGHWFTESDGRTDPRTGANERRSIHPPADVSPGTYARLARLLGVRT